MVSEYHKSVEEAVYRLGKKLVAAKKIRKVFRGNCRPLSLVDPKNKFVVNYQPDIYFICRNNKKRIFEVLDSEEKKQDIIIADIIRSILVENVDSIIFIHPGDDEDEKNILAALKTIYKGLTDDLGVNISDLPNNDKTGPYRITREQALNCVKLNEKVLEYFG